jgi:hypothetical protein
MPPFQKNVGKEYIKKLKIQVRQQNIGKLSIQLLKHRN